MTVDTTLLEAVCRQAREAMLLHSVADTLEWDERTGMPVAAGEYRATQVAALRKRVHELRTDRQYGDRLDQLSDQIGDEDPHSETNATIRELRRDWQRDRKLPAELVEQMTTATVRGQQCWDAARAADDFSMFRDQLDQIIKLKREVGDRLAEGSELTAYEALLDEYEPGAREKDLEEMFDSVRTPLVELLASINGAPRKPDVSVLNKVFSIDAQRDFSHRVAEYVGFDFDRGRLDETSHPFCTTLGPNDCRILTRFDPHWLPAGLFGTLHEAGHGMYEQGLPTGGFGLPPGSFVSLGIHESQSRLWENQVGRSRAFWDWLYPETQATFAPELDAVALDDFYFAVNRVAPSLIRVEADEATYNLHIIIRFDLERQLIGGTLSVDDLPRAWDDRYESDLGIRPASAADGVLQDVHWSAGLFGYFPTYTIGNLAAAQLYDAAASDVGNLEALHANGQFGPLLDWLRAKIHFWGRRYSGSELIREATGNDLSAEPLVRYLKAKLEPLYGI